MAATKTTTKGKKAKTSKKAGAEDKQFLSEADRLKAAQAFAKGQAVRWIGKSAHRLDLKPETVCLVEGPKGTMVRIRFIEGKVLRKDVVVSPLNIISAPISEKALAEMREKLAMKMNGSHDAKAAKVAKAASGTEKS